MGCRTQVWIHSCGHMKGGWTIGTLTELMMFSQRGSKDSGSPSPNPTDFAPCSGPLPAVDRAHPLSDSLLLGTVLHPPQSVATASFVISSILLCSNLSSSTAALPFVSFHLHGHSTADYLLAFALLNTIQQHEQPSFSSLLPSYLTPSLPFL